MPDKDSKEKKRKAPDRPAVWPYNTIMLILGSAISVIFITGSIGNYKAENWLATSFLELTAAGFIFTPPYVIHRLLSREADRMAPPVAAEPDIQCHYPS